MSDPIPTLTAPIVLAHGLCGFDKILVGRRPVKEYFPGIRAGLEAVGNRILATRVSPTAGIAAPSAWLALLGPAWGAAKVHVLASMRKTGSAGWLLRSLASGSS